MATSKILVDNNNRPYVTGDTMQSDGNFVGALSSNSTVINFSIPLPRIANKGSSANIIVTRLQGALRGMTGYIAGTTNSTDILTLSSVKSVDAVPRSKSSGIVDIRIEFNNALSAPPNNTVVAFYGSVVLEFQ